MSSKVTPIPDGAASGGKGDFTKSDKLDQATDNANKGGGVQANPNKISIWWTLDSLSMSAIQISDPVSFFLGNDDASLPVACLLDCFPTLLEFFRRFVC